MSTARTGPLPERVSGTANFGRANSDGGDGVNTPAAGVSGIARANTLASACLVYDPRGSALDTAARNVAIGPGSPNEECHISPTQMLAHIKPHSGITHTDLIANDDPLIAGAYAIRQVWFIRVVDGLTGAVSWVALFAPSGVEMYFAMRVAYLVDLITGFDYAGYDAQGWDYPLNPMYVVERRDVCDRVVLGWAGRGVVGGGTDVGSEECMKNVSRGRGANERRRGVRGGAKEGVAGVRGKDAVGRGGVGGTGRMKCLRARRQGGRLVWW